MSRDEASGSPSAGERGDAVRETGTAEPSRIARRPYIQRARHIGREYEVMIELATGILIASPHLHRMAHYTSGVFDFSVDVLDDVPPHLVEPGESAASRRGNYLRAGQHLTFIAGHEDTALEELRSGRLIRTVLHSDHGAIYCSPVRPAEYVTGLTLDRTREEIDAADRTLAHLVTTIRRQIGLGSQNPGGWQTSRPVQIPDSRVAESSLTSGTRDSGQFVFRGEESRYVVNLFRTAVSPVDLHYVAYFQDGNFVSSADCLGDPSIGHLFTQITPDTRRRSYGGIGRRFKVLAGQFGHLMKTGVNGRLVRAVLDVEQGAIYYYRISDEVYLVGVTTSQPAVSKADDQMKKLADEFSQYTDSR
jgi:hypothetical protein